MKPMQHLQNMSCRGYSCRELLYCAGAIADTRTCKILKGLLSHSLRVSMAQCYSPYTVVRR